MQAKKQKGIRRSEVFTGLLLILVAFSYVTALVLDFNFVSPYSTPKEDLAYLSESITNQKISSLAWLTTAILTLATVPMFLVIFRKRLRVLQYPIGLLMLAASAGFIMMAKAGFELHQGMVVVIEAGLDQAGETAQISLLEQFNQEQLFWKIGGSCVGLWALGVSLTRFRVARIPIISTLLLMVSGPILVFYTWYDPDHLLRTGAMAGIIIGVMVFAVRLINKGLAEKKVVIPEPR